MPVNLYARYARQCRWVGFGPTQNPFDEGACATAGIQKTGLDIDSPSLEQEANHTVNELFGCLYESSHWLDLSGILLFHDGRTIQSTR